MAEDQAPDDENVDQEKAEPELTFDLIQKAEKGELTDNVEQEDTSSEQNTETSEPDKKEGQSIEDSTQESSDESPKDFVFDRDKYEKLGITDHKALGELEKRDRQVWEKDKELSRRGNKWGKEKQGYEARLKEIQSRLESLADAKEMSDEEFDELHIESPSKARKLAEEQQKQVEERQRLETEQLNLKNREWINSQIEGFDDLIDPLAEMITGDFPDQVDSVRAFKDSPYSQMPYLLFSMGKRLQAENKIKDLESEVTRLGAELKKKPGDVVKKINEVTQSPFLSTSSGKSNSESVGEITPSSMMFMTTDQLKKAISTTE